MAGTNELRTRDAVSATSESAVAASARAAAAFGSLGAVSIEVLAPAAASRSTVR